MKIVEPSVTLIHCTSEPERTIERMGRICYQSNHKVKACESCQGEGRRESIIVGQKHPCEICHGTGTDIESAIAFIKMILSNGHESVLEHASAGFSIVTDRGVTHEIVRHRLASYSQECISGRARLSRNFTIAQLWEGKTPKKYIKSAANGVIISNSVMSTFYKGRAPVFKVETQLGYKTFVTKAHEFQTKDGSFARLKDLCVGDSVMVNGRPSLLTITDASLKHLYLKDGLAPEEIARIHGAPYRTILRRLHALGIFQAHKNDKNPGKYQRGHTILSVEKMRQNILSGYAQGRKVWNRLLTEDQHPSVKKQAIGLRKHHHNNEVGPANSCWKGGVSRSYGQRRKLHVLRCELCDRSGKLHTHHLDENPKNNTDRNLIRICVNCHVKLHRGWWVGTITHADRIESITPAGVEDVFDLEMKGPFHNYIADGFVMHNSTRYCNYSKDSFEGEISFIEPPLPELPGNAPPQLWYDAMYEAECSYLHMVNIGIAPQIARSVLPNSLKSEIGMTANFREWRHFLRLRTSPKAHPQMRQIAEMIRSELLKLSVVCFEDIT